MAFLGRANFLLVTLDPAGVSAGVETPMGVRLRAQPADPLRVFAARAKARLAIRPEHVQVRRASANAQTGEFSASVVDLIYRGALAEVLLQASAAGGPVRLSADLPAEGLNIQRGDTVAVRLPDEHCLIFEENGA